MQLLDFINSLTPKDQVNFAKKCRTTIGYLRKAISKGQNLGPDICVEIEKHSDGKVKCEDIRTDVDWAYLRQTSVLQKEEATLINQSVTHECSDQRLRNFDNCLSSE